MLDGYQLRLIAITVRISITSHTGYILHQPAQEFNISHAAG
jgi:hypothetical protein